jgi:hypothetical protein
MFLTWKDLFCIIFFSFFNLNKWFLHESKYSILFFLWFFHLSEIVLFIAFMQCCLAYQFRSITNSVNDFIVNKHCKFKSMKKRWRYKKNSSVKIQTTFLYRSTIYIIFVKNITCSKIDIVETNVKSVYYLACFLRHQGFQGPYRIFVKAANIKLLKHALLLSFWNICMDHFLYFERSIRK